MRCVIVTGMSGAGKSTALKMLEDMGYFCVDNLPVPLIPKMAELLSVPGTEINKAALGVDIRSGQNFSELEKILKDLDQSGTRFEILYLESSDDVLIKRYKETRRFHPLSGKGGRVEEGIREERKRLKFLRERADYLIDSSHMLTRELRAELSKIFVENKEYKNLYISVLSFGFKYGIPADADLVFDVRFLPNPYYIDELRPKSGNDREVREYVMNNDKAREFLAKLTDMIEFLIPNYVQEGKTQLVIGIGCTGGKHRSVTLANELYEALQETEKKVAAPKAEPVNSIVKEEKAKPEEKKAEKKAEEKKTEPKAAEKKTAEKKVTAKKAEEKAPAKKTTAKKTTTKKTTAKKSTAKKEIKVSAFVEYYGKQVEEKEIIARVKKAWTSSGNKIGDIKTMDLYIKPEESAVYYVINGTSTGAVAF